MKINQKMKTLLPLATAMGTLALTANAATIIGEPIGIDFINGASTQSGDPVNTAGLTLSTQTNAWNTIKASSTPVSVTTAEGPTFNLNLTNANTGSSHISDTIGSGLLRGSGFYGNKKNDGGLPTGGTDWELTGLVANGIYSLIFFQYGGNVGYDWDVAVGSGFTKSRDSDGDTNFVGIVANGSGVISGSTTYFSSNVAEYHASSGLQFEQTGVVAVPEPTTTALLGLGGLALILRRRK